MILTTCCYIEKDGCYLLMHRTKKKIDVNKDKWIGVGGKFEEDETPEECLLRETFEETGLTLTSYRLRGLLTFICENERGKDMEYIFLYTADGFTGELKTSSSSEEGELVWVPKKDIWNLNLWEGDKLFLRLLEEDAPYFSLKLVSQGDDLVDHSVEFC